MTASGIQIWVGIIGTLVTIGGSVLGVINSQRRRDRSASVGAAFRAVVDSLASENATLRMTGAILLRRFFDASSEQGAAHLSYAKEAVAVIAGLLRESETSPLQKALADGLRYAPSLSRADLQGCNLSGAFLGQKRGDEKTVNLASADFFEANLTEASLRGVNAVGTAFVGATLTRAVLTGANLTGADFRAAKLDGAKFNGAQIADAQFSGAIDIPADIAARLNADGRIVEQGVVNT